ncbi:hypothetical protein IWX47DRAFT_857003, partial [Phyllosticta citricarpa]
MIHFPLRAATRSFSLHCFAPFAPCVGCVYGIVSDTFMEHCSLRSLSKSADSVYFCLGSMILDNISSALSSHVVLALCGIGDVSDHAREDNGVGNRVPCSLRCPAKVLVAVWADGGYLLHSSVIMEDCSEALLARGSNRAEERRARTFDVIVRTARH